nr:E3 ubiquitin-protein ligase RKP isoform X1 [Tanacetum cinerariifolium]
MNVNVMCPIVIILKRIYNEDLDSTLKNDRFDTKSYLLESLLNRDTLMASSPKFDSLLEEFSGELAHTDLIPSIINEANCDLEEDIHLVERLLYDNSSPRPPKEFNSKNSDAIIESFSPFPIPVKDSGSLREEIDLFLTLDDSMPQGIKNDNYDSEGYILFLEELLSNDSPSLPKNESFHFDVPSSLRPSAKPPDDEIYFDDELVTGILTIKVVGDISEHYVLIPRLLPTLPALASNEEKSPPSSSHRGLKLPSFFIIKSRAERVAPVLCSPVDLLLCPLEKTESKVTFAVTNFSDPRIASAGLEDLVLQSVSVFVQYKEYLTSFESNQAAIHSFSTTLLSASDNRSWIPRLDALEMQMVPVTFHIF